MSIVSRVRKAPRILVAWRGKSLIDEATIRVVAYCLKGGSKSRKIGPMAQVLICPDDVYPHDAVKTGTDGSVCGNCPLRPASGGGCYCNLGQHYPQVWKTSTNLVADLDTACEALHRSGLPVRIGSWGDPSAVPFDVILALVNAAKGPNGKARHTMYTHDWRNHPELRETAMASVLSVTEQKEAEQAGWRTLRIRLPDMPVLQGEVVCPASKEAGHRATCSKCLMCCGTGLGKGAHAVIQAHGSANKVNALQRLIDEGPILKRGCCAVTPKKTVYLGSKEV